MTNFLNGLGRWFGEMVTSRASIFTPWITAVVVVGVFCTIAYAQLQTWLAYLPGIAVLLYSFYAHEYMMRKMPHMLVPEKTIQRYGMQLESQGHKGSELKPADIEVLPKTTKPPSKQEKK